MIFKFFKQDKTQPAEASAETPAETAAEVAAEAVDAVVATAAANDTAAPEPDSAARGVPAPATARTNGLAGALGAGDLRRETDAASWGGLGSDEIEPLGCLSQQQEALAEIGLALGGAPVEAGFVVMPPGGGLWSQLAEHVRGLAAERSVPADWVYAGSLDADRRLLALPLPPGRGRAFAAAVGAALDELAVIIPTALSGDDHTLRRQTIAEEVRLSFEQPLEDLRVRAKAQNVAMLRTPAGYTLAPMHESKVVRPELFAQLPAPMQREVETRIATLERELETILEASTGAERTRRRRLLELEAETVRPHVAAALAEVKAQLADADEAAAHIAALEEELVTRAALVRPDSVGKGLQRYAVDIAAARPHGHEEAPFVEAVQPTRERLSGAVVGGRVVPGLLHRAYGGVLLVDARDLVADDGAREAIAAALRTRHVLPCASAPGPLADPIPLALSIVIGGDREALDRLTEADPGLTALAPVIADLGRPVARTPEAETQAARVVAVQVREAGLTGLDGAGLARLVEECSRLAGDRERLMVGSECVVRLAAEAGARARRAGRTAATREDVAQAIAARSMRARRCTRAAVVLGAATAGSAVTVTANPGQPITLIKALARTGPARGRGGRVSLLPHGHTSAFLLSSALVRRFGADATAGLAAMLTADGPPDAVRDPLAGAARLAALLSSLGEVALSQRLAVIGDIEESGALRMTPGLDAAIEAVHALSVESGDGPEGIIVPVAARDRLMLGEEVATSVAGGRFSIVAAQTIDEVISFLTVATETAESLHERIAARLDGLAARRS